MTCAANHDQLVAVPSSELSGSSRARAVFWTMVLMRPNKFQPPYYFERRDDLPQGHPHEMVDDMADIAHKCLLTVLDRWEVIADYFDELLCEKRALLSPAYHDTLLTDDPALSRSKKYFWAIEFLKELEKSVSDNIRQSDRFLEYFKANPPPRGRLSGSEIERAVNREYESRLKKQYTALAKLEALRARFALKREEAVALRDGLFNASTVMESRISTKLGQNIKLLTWVSIFFLPLSFCTVSTSRFPFAFPPTVSHELNVVNIVGQSLWSISDELFSMSALAATMPAVAILTYIISINLDSIVLFWASFQRQVQSCFSLSPHGDPHNANIPPSPWWISALASAVSRLRRPFPWPWNRRARKKRKQEEILDDYPGPAHLGKVHVKVDIDVETCNSLDGVGNAVERSARKGVLGFGKGVTKHRTV